MRISPLYPGACVRRRIRARKTETDSAPTPIAIRPSCSVLGASYWGCCGCCGSGGSGGLTPRDDRGGPETRQTRHERARQSRYRARAWYIINKTNNEPTKEKMRGEMRKDDDW